MDAYWCAYHRKKNGSPDGDIWAAIQWAAVYTPEENALYDWLTIIAIKNWPVTSVEDPAYRWQSKHQYKISYKHIAMIAFLTGEVVEEKIDTMLVNKKAIALYDGLTRDTFHEVCLYVSMSLGSMRRENLMNVNIFLSSAHILCLPRKELMTLLRMTEKWM